MIEKKPTEEDDGKTPATRELEEIKESLADTQPVGSLIQLAKTVDQAKALLTFAEAISEKTLASTVALTAGRGRGKSAVHRLRTGIVRDRFKRGWTSFLASPIDAAPRRKVGAETVCTVFWPRPG